MDEIINCECVEDLISLFRALFYILKDVNNPLNHKPAPPNTYHIMNARA